MLAQCWTTEPSRLNFCLILGTWSNGFFRDDNQLEKVKEKMKKCNERANILVIPILCVFTVSLTCTLLISVIYRFQFNSSKYWPFLMLHTMRAPSSSTSTVGSTSFLNIYVWQMAILILFQWLADFTERSFIVDFMASLAIHNFLIDT